MTVSSPIDPVSSPPPASNQDGAGGSNQTVIEVAIIDDAFDPIDPARLQDGINSFWTDIQDIDEAVQELASVGVALNSADDISGEVLERLLANRSQLSTIKEPFERLLGAPVDSFRGDVFRLRDMLSEQGMKVSTFGKLPNIKDIQAEIVFLDYFLEGEQAPRGIGIVKELLLREESAMPLVVVMSSRTSDISPSDISDFQTQSGLIKGLFQYVSKNDLVNPVKLPILLTSYKNAAPYGMVMQEFLEQIQAALENSSKEFLNGVKSLGLEDYAYIQRLSLFEDGHPLGDYMQWLFSSYLGYILFERDKVLQTRRKVDALQFQKLPPAHLAPSDVLAKMYQSALFDTSIDPEGTYPSDVSDVQDKQPYVHIGDVYLSKEKDHVWIIISAQCDLSYSFSGTREYDAKRVVLLMKGELRNFRGEITKRNKPRTEPLEIEGQSFRIEWDTKQTKSIEYGELPAWQKSNGYTRTARLRLPYALEVQRAFASDLTRIGLPVPPPSYQPVDVSLNCSASDDKKHIALGPLPNAGMIVPYKAEAIGQAKPHLVLTVKTVCALRDSLKDLVGFASDQAKSLGERSDAADNKKRIERYTKTANECDKLGKDDGYWNELIKPILLPKVGSIGNLGSKNTLRLAVVKSSDADYEIGEQAVVEVHIQGDGENDVES